ncbi:Uncharacterised protein [BD1-7 clade bacterium]|uniref:Probable membrane transporter protein n=1 Tax=BD1-7 clade bacterium TaxID=2029982 RepID=A0A5S9MSK3_9GAMM|nr:Uncharacterised protein [BD1-7 clade bacterium]CAA0084456.1 Uncharacterised protein [BD1-7 clade bacterium]
MLTTLLIFLVMGTVAGLIAGMFGVGGGVIIVPALVYVFSLQGISADVLTHLAVGSSLAVITVTAISSVLAHHRNGFVQWHVFRVMLPGLVFGVVGGVMVAVNIPGHILQWTMGCFLIVVALQMRLALVPTREEGNLPGAPVLLGGAGVTGIISALFGVGGGTITVPFLTFFGMRMQQAVATSAACGLPLAVFGATSNIVAGWQTPGLPDYALGYVYLPAVIGIAVASAPAAKVGAQIAKNLSDTKLKRIFAIFLAMIGASMIAKATGIF